VHSYYADFLEYGDADGYREKQSAKVRDPSS
jgi:hypothetical protein